MRPLHARYYIEDADKVVAGTLLQLSFYYQLTINEIEDMVTGKTPCMGIILGAGRGQLAARTDKPIFDAWAVRQHRSDGQVYWATPDGRKRVYFARLTDGTVVAGSARTLARHFNISQTTLRCSISRGSKRYFTEQPDLETTKVLTLDELADLTCQGCYSELGTYIPTSHLDSLASDE
jgi:hypothetical protein